MTPSAATSAGAQWRVDGGGWKNSGATVNNLSAGTHQVEFKSVSGWLAPDTTSASIVTGSTTTLTAVYVQPAALQITLTPSSGQWRVDGGTWRASGTTATGLTPTSHTIEYAAVSGYAAPAVETVALTAGQTTTLTRGYTQLASVLITLTPSQALWRLDGGAWQASGATVANLAVGSHSIDYVPVSGYDAPPPETVALAAGQALTLNRAYVKLADLTVNFGFNLGNWRINGGGWRAPGNPAINLQAGSYFIEYLAFDGYAAPPPETVVLAQGQSLTLDRPFTKLANVTVTLTPGAGQWRINGSGWYASGATYTNLAPGTYTIDYSAVAGYITPPSETVTVASGDALSLNRSYVQAAQLAVTLSPTNGQWRVNGGAWQASGATLANLAPGNYTIEYSALPNPAWGPPPTETVALVAGQSLAVTRNYTQLNQVLIGLVPSTGTWRLAGGAWQASGTTLWVQPGTYTLEYSPLDGYDPPASETFTGGIAATRYYTSTKPTLRMNLTPATAQWRVDGGAWQASGAQVTELAVGAHSIDYTDVGGDFNPLPSETISLALRENAVLSRTYPSKPASVAMTISPANAQWILAYGPTTVAWQTGNATVTGLTPGNYTIIYSTVEGYNAPPSEPITLAANQQAAFTRSYTAQPAQVTVTLSVSAAQWRLSTAAEGPGPWKNSGTTATGLAAGNYTIEYGGWFGYDSPPNEPIALAPGQSVSLSRTYTPRPAQIKIHLTPGNGQWRIYPAGGAPGGEWQASDATVSGLAAGNFTVEYAPLTGYDAPATETIPLYPGDSQFYTRMYTARPAQITVVTSPSSGQWRIYPELEQPSGPWNASGATVTGLGPYSYNIQYSTLTGYNPPSETNVVFGPGEAKTITANYSALPATITVALTPSAAQWRVDGGAWNASGAWVSNLAVGNHIIEFSNVSGYTTPGAQTVAVAASELKELSFTYGAENLPSITAYITPSSGQWRVDGGTWLASGVPASSLSVGSHTVEFSHLVGYVTPAPVTVTLAPGENREIWQGHAYGPASISITLANSIGRWRYEAWPWSSSGAGLQVTSGTHTIEYEPVPGYTAPPTETVLLEVGENLTLSRAYIPLSPATLRIDLTPSQAQWRIYPVGSPAGGAWNAAGASLSNIEPGSYTIEYGAVPGYTTPFPESITLAAGEMRSLTRTYTASTSGYAEIAALPDLGSQGYLIRGSDAVLYGITNSQGGNSGGTFFRVNPDGTGFTLLRSFSAYTNDGQNASALLESSDGWLYGATQYGGGTVNRGTIFRTGRDGGNYTIVRIFATAAEGLSPNTLLEASDGLLYGTTLTGGTSDTGVIFKMNKDGSSYTVLKHFSSMSVQGRYAARLTESTDGGLYGTIRTGGANGVGLIYRLNKDGSGYALVKTFAGGADGASPQVALFRASDGLLYGSTSSGGTFNRGTAFRLNADGTGHLVLKNFAGDTSEGGAPATEFQEDGGVLYGATSSGGPGARGTVFKMNRDGTGFVTLKSFAGTPQEGGSMLWAPIVVGGGTINGASRLGGGANEGVLFRLNTDGSNFGVLKHLGAPNGSLLMTPVVEGSDGALYGTSYYGGLTREGTVYKVNKDGTGFAVLRQFSGLHSTFSQSVLSASDGLLYGAAQGSSGGEIYRINRDGSGLTTIRSFVTEVPESVIEGSDGVFYGNAGGGTAGVGTVFKMNKDGTGYAILRSFLGGTTDGKYPSGTLSEGPDGFLYGTTTAGGSADVGIIYRIAKDGSGYTVLRHFANSATDGAKPYAGVLFGSDGQLYGTTSAGGSTDSGVVYKISPNGSGFAVLHHFLGSTGNDGAGPSYAGVIERNGTLYGTTGSGGAFSRGTLFKLERDGSGYTTLINFGANLGEGSVPAATLLRASDGNLYGTTFHGGNGSVVFRFGPN